MMTEKQWMLLGMRRISCFVIIIINNNILERLVGNFMATLVRRGGRFGGVKSLFKS
jgi:hypothetical protein